MYVGHIRPTVCACEREIAPDVAASPRRGDVCSRYDIWCDLNLHTDVHAQPAAAAAVATARPRRQA